DFRQQCKKKVRRDRRERRVRIEASCASITAEHLLDFVIGRQIAPEGTFFDDLPLFLSDVFARAPLFNFPRKPLHFLLIFRWPVQHAIKDFFHLLFCHDFNFHARRKLAKAASISSLLANSPRATCPRASSIAFSSSGVAL